MKNIFELWRELDHDWIHNFDIGFSDVFFKWMPRIIGGVLAAALYVLIAGLIGLLVLGWFLL